MDMVLYALLKGKIDEQTLSSTGKVDKVGDYEIRIVDSIPDVKEENYIYIVTRTAKPKDTMVVGGKGVECILCGIKKLFILNIKFLIFFFFFFF